MLHVEWYHVCWPRLTAKRVEPVVSISWASCLHLCHVMNNMWIHIESCRQTWRHVTKRRTCSGWKTVSYRAFTLYNRRAHRSVRLVCPTNRMKCVVYTLRSTNRLVGPTQVTSDWLVRPVGSTGRTHCSWTAHIWQSSQCGVLAD